LYLRDDQELANVQVSNQLRKLFISYTRRINLTKNRTGGLFTKSFQRIVIKDNFYLKTLVVYIHRNPLNHGLMIDFQNYRFSSFQSFLLGDNTLIENEQVLIWFEGRESFYRSHVFNTGDQPLFDIHYLEGDGVPYHEIESQGQKYLSTALF